MDCQDRNGSDKNMCMKIKELNGLSANDLLLKTGQADVFPIDIAQMCKDLHIVTKPFDFSEIENSPEIKPEISKRGNILGVVLAKDNQLAILYRQSDTTNRKRFTIAHELAHCCLHMSPDEDVHIEFRFDETSESSKEINANIFAGELLIPEKIINMFATNKTISKNVMLVLCNILIVSKNVMVERLKHLGIEII